MSEDLSAVAITDAISSFSIANHPPDGQQKPPPPGIKLNRDIVSRSSRSKDITSNFLEATSQLQTGELVKDDFFTLFDSVGALEIGDPKMDTGWIEPGESFEDDYDVSRPLLPDELISIMDTLLSLQVAWLTGYPLSQTVFASVYVENILWPDPKTLDEASFRQRGGSRIDLSPCQSMLRVYCLLLVKSCDFLHRRISEETYYEEEDFFTQLYNRSLLSAFQSDHIFTLEEEVTTRLVTDETIAETQREAINSRIRLQSTFAKALKASLESDSPFVIQSWQDLLQILPSLRASHQMGVPVPTAISSKIQRKLASSVPPRPVVELEFDAAIDFLTRLCKDGVLAEDISQCSDLGSVVAFISFFQAQHPQPTVYMRCQIQRLVLDKFEYLGDPFALVSARYDLFNELKRLVYPSPELLDVPDTSDAQPSEVVQKMQRFVSLVKEPFWAYIRALTMNRSRTRRMLWHTAMDWDSAQLELEDVDSELRQFTKESPLKGRNEELHEYPLSSWAYDIKLRQLILVYQLGFEMEIYHKEEMSSAYWSLQWICAARHTHLERIMLFVRQKGSKLTRPTRAQAEEYNTTILTLHYHMDVTIATAALAEGLSSLYRALMLFSLVPNPPSAPYSTDSLRHDLRNRPFTHIIQPPLPNAIEAEAARKSFTKELITAARATKHKPPRSSFSPHIEEALALLDHTDDMVKSARTGWDNVSKTEIQIARAEACEQTWRADIKNVQKSAIAIGLASMGLRKWIDAGARAVELLVSVEMGHGAGYHVFWVVPKLKNVKINNDGVSSKSSPQSKRKG